MPTPKTVRIATTPPVTLPSATLPCGIKVGGAPLVPFVSLSLSVPPLIRPIPTKKGPRATRISKLLVKLNKLKAICPTPPANPSV